MSQTEKDLILQESVEYFRARPVYQKIFRKIKMKYAGLGRLGGTVQLVNLKKEEKEQLSGFFQKDYAENKTVTISVKMMEKCLASSRFSALTWEEILEAYFGERLLIRKEAENAQREEREQYFTESVKALPAGRGKDWLESVLKEQSEGYLYLMQLYKEDRKKLSQILENVMRAVAELEKMKTAKEKELFPVFAAKMTGDPHAFDEGHAEEKLLFYYLQSRGKKMEEAFSKAEYKNMVYFEAGLLKDEVSNDVLAYGVHGKKADGSVHAGMEGFWECREPVKLTLQTIGKLESIWGETDMVYVVENPAVFSVLIQEHPDWTVICGNGQLRLAVWVLLEHFPGTTVFYYAGDFDPEGLMIAQRLKYRYQDRLKLWHYHVSWYQEHLSAVTLSDRRLKKLERIQIEELLEMKAAMLREKKAAYQETMIWQLCEYHEGG